MHSYLVGWEIRIVAWDLTYFSSLCVLEVKVLVRLFICGVSEPSQLVYTCNKYQNLRCWLICYFNICILNAWLCKGLDSKNKLSIQMLIISYLIVLPFVYGAQKNRLIETLFLSTSNICFSWKIRKLIFIFTPLSGGLALWNWPVSWYYQTLISWLFACQWWILSSAADLCKQFWTQIKPDKTSGLIWIQTDWHWVWKYSWENFFKKVHYE